MTLDEVERRAVAFRNVEEERFRRRHLRAEEPEQACGQFGTVREQRADLVSAPAGTHDAVAGESSLVEHAGCNDAALPEACRGQLLENANTIGPTYSTPPPRYTFSQLARLSMPALILSGADSRAFYRRSAQAAAACIAGTRSGVVGNARHMVIVENPEATAAAMLDFLITA